MARNADPYQMLGVSRSASDAELRAAYRKLVLLHHPDHNGGSVESARRFEEVQDAYAEVRRLHQGLGGGDRVRARPGTASPAGGPGGGSPGAPAGGSDPDFEARLAAMERELKTARDARERAAREAGAVRQAAEQALRDARAAARGKGTDRPSDEELGYISTDDSFTKILDDVTSTLADSVSEVRESPAGRRLSDLIDELGSKLTGEPRDRDDGR